MQIYLQIIILAFSLFILLIVWGLVRQGQLRPAYALLWLIGAILLFLFSIFKGLVNMIAEFLHVDYVPMVMVGFTFIFLTVLLLSQSVIISNLARHNRDLAENIAILQWRLENIEKNVFKSENN